MGGGLYYPTHDARVLIGTKSGTTRTSWQLESTYQTEGTTKTTKTFDTAGYAQLNLDCIYTTGTGETSNSIQLKLESSADRTNFYQLTNESASSGTSTLTQREFTFAGAAAATSYTFSIRVDISYKNMKVWAKETGVSANKGTFFVEATLSGM